MGAESGPGPGEVKLIRCRTNAIKLNWRQRFQGGVDCPVCESGADCRGNAETFSEGLSRSWRHQGDPQDKRGGLC